MASLPTGRLTRKQIVDLACRRAGNTQLAAGPNFDAQTWLNQILYDLAWEWSWPTLMSSTTLTITGPTASLPADFLKAQDDAGLVLLTVNGSSQRIFLDEVDRYTFEVAQPPTVGSGGFPRIWHADRNAGLARFFPDPSGNTITATLRYQALPADIPVDTSGDASVPWFLSPWYLVQELFVRILEFEADGRADAEREKANRMLEKVRQAAKPLRAQEPVIPLDTQVFGTPFVRD